MRDVTIEDMLYVTRKSIAPRNHAMIYVYLVKACREFLRGDSEKHIETFTINYARRRGRRMAKRALRDGNELSALNFEVYGEWKGGPEDMNSGLELDVPEINVWAKKCPWYDVWANTNMLEYGKPYCRVIDENLVRGFREDLFLDVISNRTNGGELCDFYYRGIKASDEDIRKYKECIKNIGMKGKKDWNFHTADLFYCIKDYLADVFPDTVDKIIDQAKLNYRDMYGKLSVDVLLEWENHDFESIDDYAGISEKID